MLSSRPVEGLLTYWALSSGLSSGMLVPSCPSESSHTQALPASHLRPPSQIMHCYIDSEQFDGLTIDEALRRLLANFRWGHGHSASAVQ